jgi:hypothetical protein
VPQQEDSITKEPGHKPVKSSNDQLDQEELDRVTGGVGGGWNRVKN